MWIPARRCLPTAPSLLVLAVAILALTVLPACESISGPSNGAPPGTPTPITELPRALSLQEEEAIRVGNAFGFELLNRVAEEDREASVFLSPFSATMALGMALTGAGGETFEAMSRTLGLEGLDREEFLEAYGALLELLVDLDPDVELAIGNSLWHSDQVAVRDLFRSEIEEYFGARIQGLDFSSPQAAGTINDWVREATRDRIEEIVDDPIDPNIIAYLINAVYFKAGWTEVFDPELTREAPFHRLDGRTETVELMIRDDTLRHHSTERYDAVDLPYAGGAFSMTVVVPAEGVGVHELAREMDAEAWDELTGSFQTRRAQIWLPRFELEWDAELDDILIAMGMGPAFQPGADFTRIFENAAPWIDEVKQKTFVRVDEEGTEAAAVTSVAMPTSLPPQVRADRPFLLAIRERLSGTILFVGLIVEPPRL